VAISSADWRQKRPNGWLGVSNRAFIMFIIEEMG